MLLLSGKDDTLWPSTLMSDQVTERLERHRHPYRYEHVAYDDAGHLISRLPYLPAATTTRLGGTARGNAHATYQAWRKALDFLAEALAAP